MLPFKYILTLTEFELFAEKVKPLFLLDKVGVFNVKNCYDRKRIVLSGQEHHLIKVRNTNMLNLYPNLKTNIKTLKEQWQCAHKISGNGETILTYVGGSDEQLIADAIECCLPLVPALIWNRIVH